MNLVFEYFYQDLTLVSKEELRDSINICVANLPDLIIDYPNGKQYACSIIVKAVELSIMTKEDGEKYTTHIQNLDSSF